VGGFTHRVKKKTNTLTGPRHRQALVGTGNTVSILFGINGLTNKPSDLVGPSFPENAISPLRDRLKAPRLASFPAPYPALFV